MSPGKGTGDVVVALGSQAWYFGARAGIASHFQATHSPSHRRDNLPQGRTWGGRFGQGHQAGGNGAGGLTHALPCRHGTGHRHDRLRRHRPRPSGLLFRGGRPG
jgi:hypothetical protein